MMLPMCTRPARMYAAASVQTRNYKRAFAVHVYLEVACVTFHKKCCAHAHVLCALTPLDSRNLLLIRLRSHLRACACQLART
jgi:hypothetical protein